MRRAQARPYLRSLEALGSDREFGGDSVFALDGALDARMALNRLPEKLRDVVLLYIFQGLSHREAAQALEIPVGTVKSRMLLAVRRLQEVFDVPSA